MCRSVDCIGPIDPRVVAIDSDYWEIARNPIRFNHFEYKKIKINKFFIQFTTLFQINSKIKLFIEKLTQHIKTIKHRIKGSLLLDTIFSQSIVSKHKKLNSIQKLIAFRETNNCFKNKMTTKIQNF